MTPVIIEENKELNEVPNIFRYSTILAKNGISFYNQFGKDGTIISDVLYYIAYIYQFNFERYYRNTNPNLFQEVSSGFVSFEFDVQEFCDLMGYKKSNLQKLSLDPAYLKDHFGKKMTDKLSFIESLGKSKSKHLEENRAELYAIIKGHNPKFNKDLSNLSTSVLKDKALQLEIESFRKVYPEDIHWKTVLDNVIYTLGTEKIKFRFDGDSGKFSTSVVGGVEFVRAVTKHVLKENRNKVYYSFSINKEFEGQMIHLYSLVNLRHLIKARKPNLRFLYEYVLSQAKTVRINKTNRYETDFSLLCELGLIEIEDSSDAKQKIKRKFVALKEDMGLDVEITFEKRNASDKWKYKPILIYGKKLLTNTEDGAENYHEAFRICCKHELYRFYSKKYTTHSQIRWFDKWLSKYELDYLDKVDIYKKTYKMFFRKSEFKVHVMDQWFRRFKDYYDKQTALEQPE